MAHSINVESILGLPRVDPLSAFTRRGFLGLGALAVRALSANPKASSFEFLRHQNSVEFRGNGLWTIDADRFAGRPRLTVSEGSGRILLSLRDARFPGTDFPADFSCEIIRTLTGWQSVFCLPSLGIEYSLPFDSWLDGSIPVVGKSQPPISLVRNGGIGILGPVEVVFRPDWSYTFTGNRAILLTMDGHQLSSHSLLLELPEPTEAHLLAPAATKRSTMFIERNDAVWDLYPPRQGPSGSWLHSGKNPFVAIRVEMGEDDTGSRRPCFVAQAGTHADLRFCPGTAYLDQSGAPFYLSLQDASYAVTGEGSSKEFALVGRLSPSPVWLHAAGLSLKLAGGPDAPPFQMTGGTDKPTDLKCDCSLLGITAPLTGATVRVETPSSRFGFVPQDKPGDPQTPSAALGKKQKILLPAPPVEVLRSEDLLLLRFEFSNLALVPGKRRTLFQWLFWHPPFPATLERLDPTQPSFLVVKFPPQHVAEKAIFEDATGSADSLPTAPVGATLSGESRLAFRVPENIGSIDYTLPSLLDWNRLDPSIVPTGVSRSEGTAEDLRAPNPIETAIELPYRLLLSSNERSAWAHTSTPVDLRDDDKKITWAELWHTRLAVRVNSSGTIDEDNEELRTVRAIHSLDSGPKGTPPPPACQENMDPPTHPGNSLDAMSARDRFEIVHLSANFNDLQSGEDKLDLAPEPIKVVRLMLSSLGAWISAQGNWDPADLRMPNGTLDGLSVREWRQHSGMGRDQYVRVVYGGFLYPYGHRANLVQITERKFQRKDAHSPIKAYLRQRIYITVQEPVKEYDDVGLDPEGNSVDRQMPFRALEITTLVTPNLDRPPAGQLKYPCYFWPRVTTLTPSGARYTQDFLFHFIGRDVAGQSVEFTSPVIFFEYGQRGDPNAIRTVIDAFVDSGAYRRSFAGQRIAFAPPREPGDTTLEASAIYFSAYADPDPSTPPVPLAVVAPAVVAAAASGTLAGDGICCSAAPKRRKSKPPFKTHVPKAEVKLPAASGLTGVPSPDVPFEWDPDYKKSGFTSAPNSPNFGELFGKIGTLPFRLPDIHSVSLFKPDFDLSGLSRKFGAIGGDLPKLKIGQFNPTALFPPNPLGGGAKFLGLFPLSKLLGADLPQMPNFGTLGAQILPKTNTRVIYDAQGIPIRVEAYIDWYPKLYDTNLGVATVTFPSTSTALVEVAISTQVRGGGSTFSLSGEVKSFALSIIGAIDISFKALTFSSQNGQGLSVHVDIENVAFRGGLAFLSKLQEQFGSSLFGPQGPRVQLEGANIVASAGFALPNIGFGAFSLQHLSLAASLRLPLAGDQPISLGVNFGSRNDPFLVSVTILGGGGFLMLGFGPDGVQSIELAIEAGGVVSLDLFVAHGSAYILIGVGMKYDRSTEAARKRGLELSLFLRAGGSLDVLGLITVSVEFSLTFTYTEGTGQVCGDCTVTVSIDIMFFSIDVNLTLHRCLQLKDSSNEDKLLDAFLQTPSQALFERIIEEDDWDAYCGAFAKF